MDKTELTIWYRNRNRAYWTKYSKSPKGILRRNRFRQTAKGKAAEYKQSLRSRAANPLRYAAYQAVQYGLRIGRLARPAVCSWCWLTRKTHAHHYMGYDKKNKLRVLWLCRKCHDAAHKENFYE